MAAATQQNKEDLGFFGRIAQFIKEVREEGKKVTWPSKEKARVDTVVVLLASGMLALLIGVEDYVLSYLFQLYLGG
jgi:preprotein translocase subunit SecE